MADPHAELRERLERMRNAKVGSSSLPRQSEADLDTLAEAVNALVEAEGLRAEVDAGGRRIQNQRGEINELHRQIKEMRPLPVAVLTRRVAKLESLLERSTHRAESAEARLEEPVLGLEELLAEVDEHERKMGGTVYEDEAKACWTKACSRLWSSEARDLARSTLAKLKDEGGRE